MKITAKEFIQIWEQFTVNKIINTEWQTYWNSNTDWSNFLLGKKLSSYKDSPIGKYFQDIYGEDKLGFRSEDGLVDLSLFDKSSAFSFQGLDKNWKSSPFTRNDYPSHYMAIVEHENQLYTSWEEIAKLTYFRSMLKVLITYHSSENLSQENRNLEISMMENSFKSVLTISNETFPENELTEYLLIMGGVVNDQLTWKYSIFNPKGEIKKSIEHE